MPPRPPGFLGKSTSIRFSIPAGCPTTKIRFQDRAVKVAMYQWAKSGRYGTIELYDGYKATFNLDDTLKLECKQVIPICHCLLNFPYLKLNGRRTRGYSKATSACFRYNEMGHWASDCVKKSMSPYGSCVQCGDVTHQIEVRPVTLTTGPNRIRHEQRNQQW